MQRIQWKIVLLVALVIAGTLSAVVWKTRAVVLKDKLSFMADSAMKQVAPLKRLVQDRMEIEKSKLVKFAANRANSGPGRSRGFSEFEVIALIEPQQGAQWTPSWIEKSTTARAEIWPQGYELTLLKSLPYGKVRDGETVWTRLSDRQGSPIYATLISVEIQTGTPTLGSANPPESALPDSAEYAAATAGNGRKAVVVGFSTFDPLAEVTEDYIGSTSNVFLVDDKGYVASHVNKAYLGALFSEDPIVKEIMATKKTAASGNYEDLENHSVLGHFERIDRTNLYAVVTSPLQSARDLSKAVVSTALTAGSAVGLVGLMLAFLLGRGISGPIGSATAAIRALNRGEPFVLNAPNTNDELGALMRLIAESSPAALASKANWSQQRQPSANAAASGVAEPDSAVSSISNSSSAVSLVSSEPKNMSLATSMANSFVGSQSDMTKEQRSSVEAFNEGFTKAIKEPLLAILGHAQLAKGKTEASEMRGHAESIEREARRATDVLGRLNDWRLEKATIADDETVDLTEVIESVVAQVADEFKADDIEIALDLHAVPRVHGSPEQLRVAVANIVENAREALRARPKAKLRVQLDFLRDSVYLVVNDNGVGMSRDVKERAFEPFFKGFESPKRLGLGLTLVQTALRSIGGACEIESAPGEGTTFTLKFPVTSAAVTSFLGLQSMKLADNVAEKFDDSKRSESTPVLELKPEPKLTPPPLPPAGASVADTKDDFDADENGKSVAKMLHSGLDDDDNDDMFASVNLNHRAKDPVASNQAAQHEPSPEIAAPMASDDGERGAFRVRIRKPKTRV